MRCLFATLAARPGGDKHWLRTLAKWGISCYRRHATHYDNHRIGAQPSGCRSVELEGSVGIWRHRPVIPLLLQPEGCAPMRWRRDQAAPECQRRATKVFRRLSMLSIRRSVLANHPQNWLDAVYPCQASPAAGPFRPRRLLGNALALPAQGPRLFLDCSSIVPLLFLYC